MKTQSIDFQSPLANGINRFLSQKRALGKCFHTEEKVLRLLDRYLVAQRVASMVEITPAVVEAFVASRPRKAARSYNHLLSVLRRLFDWLVLQGLISQSPLVKSRLKRHNSARQSPFLFNRSQARRLLDAAYRLPPSSRAAERGDTYQMIFALLYGLGLRVGEVSRLCRQDVDLDRNLLIVRQTKFSKSRLVPFGPRMAERVRNYLQQCEIRFGSLQPEYPLFSFSKKPPKFISPTTISWTFHQLIRQLELEITPGVNPPHLHCLRHSFAVGTLLRWYRAGINPAERLIHLSTFLGHVSPTSTAVYLTITTDLLQEASQRFQRFAGVAVREARR